MASKYSIKTRLKSFGYALKGIWKLLCSEVNFQIELAAAIIAVALGFYFEISKTEWLIQTLAISLVLAGEALNTALEKLADALHPEYHPAVGKAKDIAAAGVLLLAIGALIVGALIYLPYFSYLLLP